MTTLFAKAEVERIEEVCGIYFRTYFVKAGNVIQQHKHDHDHATLVLSGRVRAWIKDGPLMIKGPGEAFEIKAGIEHYFEALEDSRLSCIHDIRSAESVKRKVG